MDEVLLFDLKIKYKINNIKYTSKICIYKIGKESKFTKYSLFLF